MLAFQSGDDLWVDRLRDALVLLYILRVYSGMR